MYQQKRFRLSRQCTQRTRLSARRQHQRARRSDCATPARTSATNRKDCIGPRSTLDTRWPHEDADDSTPLADHAAKHTALAAEPRSRGLPPLSRSTTTTSKSYKIDQTRPQKRAQQTRVARRTHKTKSRPEVCGTAATVASRRTQRPPDSRLAHRRHPQYVGAPQTNGSHARG